MHKALHHRKDVDRLYMSRKEGGGGFTSIQDSVDASIQWLKDDIKKSAKEDKKQYGQHKHLQNKNNQKTNMVTS